MIIPLQELLHFQPPIRGLIKYLRVIIVVIITLIITYIIIKCDIGKRSSSGIVCINGEKKAGYSNIIYIGKEPDENCNDDDYEYSVNQSSGNYGDYTVYDCGCERTIRITFSIDANQCVTFKIKVNKKSKVPRYRY